MQLMHDGKSSIYDKGSKYLPFLRENSDSRVANITIKEMLQHTSSISRDGKDLSFWHLQRNFPKKEEIVQFLKKEPLIIDSKTCFKYSNYAYALLGYIIETVSKKKHMRNIWNRKS